MPASSEHRKAVNEGSLPKRLRPEVRRFAQLMELKMLANDHKGQWAKAAPCDVPYFVRRAREELDELEHALEGEDGIDQALECADVANFMAIVCDLVLRKEQP